MPQTRQAVNSFANSFLADKFVQKQFMQPIASAFFDENKIYDRGWDVYVELLKVNPTLVSGPRTRLNPHSFFLNL